MDKSPEVRQRVAEYAASFQRSLTEERVAQLREDRENGDTYAQLMKKYGLAKSTVSYIINRKTYK